MDVFGTLVDESFVGRLEVVAEGGAISEEPGITASVEVTTDIIGVLAGSGLAVSLEVQGG